MSGGGSGATTTTTNNTPPQAYLDAYSNVLGQAQNAASVPYQPYPGQLQASFSPQQEEAFNLVGSTPGISAPYINQAAQYFTDATAPVNQSMQPYVDSATAKFDAAGNTNIAGAGNAYQNIAEQGFNAAGGTNIAGSGKNYDNLATTAFAQGSQKLTPQQYSGQALQQYESPYTQQVVNATQAQFNNQNAQTANQIQGNAASQGALGGDRVGVQQGVTAGQEQAAQAPVIAGLENTGFNQAQTEFNTQQQTNLSAQQQTQQDLETAAQGYMGEAGQQIQANTAQAAAQQAAAAGNAGLAGQQIQAATAQSAAQQAAGMGESGLAGQALSASQAQGWLNSQAASGMAGLGNQALSSTIQSANALAGSGATQQAQAQGALNIPYQQYLAAQSYPFQTTGWLSNIAQGLGTSSGSSGSSTAPAPSVLGQAAGLGTAGVGALGQSGAFGSNGWLSNIGGGSGYPIAGTDAAVSQGIGASGAVGDALQGTLDVAAAGNRGGAIGRGGIGGFANGGGVEDVSGTGVPMTSPLGMTGMPGSANALSSGNAVPDVTVGPVPAGAAPVGTAAIKRNYGNTQTSTPASNGDSTFGDILKFAGTAAATAYGGPAGGIAANELSSQVHFNRGGFARAPGGSVPVLPRGFAAGGSAPIAVTSVPNAQGKGVPTMVVNASAPAASTTGFAGGTGSGADAYLAQQGAGASYIAPKGYVPPPPPVAPTSGPGSPDYIPQGGINGGGPAMFAAANSPANINRTDIVHTDDYLAPPQGAGSFRGGGVRGFAAGGSPVSVTNVPNAQGKGVPTMIVDPAASVTGAAASGAPGGADSGADAYLAQQAAGVSHAAPKGYVAPPAPPPVDPNSAAGILANQKAIWQIAELPVSQGGLAGFDRGGRMVTRGFAAGGDTGADAVPDTADVILDPDAPPTDTTWAPGDSLGSPHDANTPPPMTVKPPAAKPADAGPPTPAGDSWFDKPVLQMIPDAAHAVADDWRQTQQGFNAQTQKGQPGVAPGENIGPGKGPSPPPEPTASPDMPPPRLLPGLPPPSSPLPAGAPATGPDGKPIAAPAKPGAGPAGPGDGKPGAPAGGGMSPGENAGPSGGGAGPGSPGAPSGPSAGFAGGNPDPGRQHDPTRQEDANDALRNSRGAKEDKASPWLALMNAGFGMMASGSPYAATAIGQGGMAGIKQYVDSDKAAKDLAARVDETRLRLADTQAYRSQMGGVAQQKADIAQQHQNTYNAGQVARAAYYSTKAANSSLTGPALESKAIESLMDQIDPTTGQNFTYPSAFAQVKGLNIKQQQADQQGQHYGRQDANSEANTAIRQQSVMDTKEYRDADLALKGRIADDGQRAKLLGRAVQMFTQDLSGKTTFSAALAQVLAGQSGMGGGGGSSGTQQAPPKLPPPDPTTLQNYKAYIAAHANDPAATANALRNMQTRFDTTGI